MGRSVIVGIVSADRQRRASEPAPSDKLDTSEEILRVTGQETFRVLSHEIGRATRSKGELPEVEGEVPDTDDVIIVSTKY